MLNLPFRGCLEGTLCPFLVACFTFNSYFTDKKCFIEIIMIAHMSTALHILQSSLGYLFDLHNDPGIRSASFPLTDENEAQRS